eukprot:4417028-Amphidinium_carterae.1
MQGTCSHNVLGLLSQPAVGERRVHLTCPNTPKRLIFAKLLEIVVPQRGQTVEVQLSKAPPWGGKGSKLPIKGLMWVQSEQKILH